MKKNYGLVSTIMMIVGICIGSGIFFKSDNVLIATNGSILFGVLLFCLAAMAIIFGSLTISELASRTDKEGGLVTYGEEFISQKVGVAFGWFQTFIYFPTITVVVSWVIGIYVSILFNLGDSLELQILIGLISYIIIVLYNIFIPKLGMLFQNGTTIIKLIPLILLGLLGIIFGDPVTSIANISADHVPTLAFLSALGPIAYSYDGWICATSISQEVKDAKKTLPKALMIAPLLILGIYTLYFVGISSYVGVDNVMKLGDSHVFFAANQLFGPYFSKLITVFVIISVIGTVNGLTIAFIRMPYALAIRGDYIPLASKVRNIHSRYNIPVNSALMSLVVGIFWFVIHYLFSKYNLTANSDISEIAIAMSYLLYISLYYKVVKLYLSKEIKSIFKGIVSPILATLGSFIIISGGMQNPNFIYYIIFCLLVMSVSLYYYYQHHKVKS